jgi:hypothetical protein
MDLLQLLKKGKSELSKDGAKPKSFDGQVSQLKKDFAKDSQLDLNGEEPKKYSDNKPQ